ncbi:hypothetical protein D3C87_1601790 [compost metagenome]
MADAMRVRRRYSLPPTDHTMGSMSPRRSENASASGARAVNCSSLIVMSIGAARCTTLPSLSVVSTVSSVFSRR